MARKSHQCQKRVANWDIPSVRRHGQGDMPQMIYLSQSDPRWARQKIGQTSLSIGRWGCTLTGLSMLSSYYGCYKSPAEIAKIPGLFTSDGLLIWSMVEKVFDGKIKFQYRYGNGSKSVRNDIAIRASILGSPKTSVLLEVANSSHWVVAVGVIGDDYRIVDPIDGKKKLAIKTFKNISGSAHLYQP